MYNTNRDFCITKLATLYELLVPSTRGVVLALNIVHTYCTDTRGPYPQSASRTPQRCTALQKPLK